MKSKENDTLLLIAIWDFLTAMAALIGIAAIAIFAFPSLSGLWGIYLLGPVLGLSMAILVLLIYLGLAVAAGIGLLIRKEWGRILSIVHAAFTLLNIPIGTIIGILTLVYLTRTNTREYFETL